MWQYGVLSMSQTCIPSFNMFAHAQYIIMSYFQWWSLWTMFSCQLLWEKHTTLIKTHVMNSVSKTFWRQGIRRTCSLQLMQSWNWLLLPVNPCVHKPVSKKTNFQRWNYTAWNFSHCPFRTFKSSHTHWISLLFCPILRLWLSPFHLSLGTRSLLITNPPLPPSPIGSQSLFQLRVSGFGATINKQLDVSLISALPPLPQLSHLTGCSINRTQTQNTNMLHNTWQGITVKTDKSGTLSQNSFEFLNTTKRIGLLADLC